MDPEENKDDEINVVEESDVETIEDVNDSKEIDSTKDDEKSKIIQKRKPVRKRGNNADVKIKELWKRAKEKEAMLVAATSKNMEFEKITANALEESINNKRELIKERLSRAQEIDDHAKIAELTSELSRVDAQGAQIERYKMESRLSASDKQNHQQVDYDDEPQSTPSFDDLYERQNRAGKEWLDKSRDWYDSDSDNYDEDKVTDVTYYAQSLEANFARNGVGFPPGSKGYFAAIDKYIAENWGGDSDMGASDNDSGSLPQKQNRYAAPVGNRNAANGGLQKRKEYKITRDEREMAINMKMKGKDGRELPDDDKIKRFVQLRESTPTSGPISIKDVRR